ncbi:MAG: sulfatase-like hydrolase/transferase [Rufibacter sp.]
MAVLALVAWGCGAAPKNGKTTAKPNIIIIVADDMGWSNIGFHNPQVITPNLDKLTNNGVELTRFYTGQFCTPTRFGLMTAKYPDRFGLRDIGFEPEVEGGIPVEEQTFPEMLAQAGFKNRGAFGKWHLGHSDVKYHPLSQGFTYFYGHYNGALDYFTHIRDGELDWHRNHESAYDKGYSTDLIGQEAASFINRSAKEGPFLAYVAFNAVHSPMQAKSEDLATNGYTKGGDVTRKKPVKDGPSAQVIMNAMATGMDRAVGEIVKALEANGVADNTIIWFLSDNGGAPNLGGNNAPFKGKKNTEWEGGVHNISFVYWKGKWEGGKKVDQLTGYIDVLPTLAAVVGQEVKQPIDGINVQPAILGQKLPERILFLGREAVVSPQWKLNQGELYDLQKDISEKNNVAAQNPMALQKMASALADYKKIVKPPLKRTEGFVPPKEWKIPGAGN